VVLGHRRMDVERCHPEDDHHAKDRREPATACDQAANRPHPEHKPILATAEAEIGRVLVSPRNGSEMSADHQSWIVLVTNLSGIEVNLEAIAYCAGAGQAVAAAAPRAAHARAVRQAQAMLARLRRERLATAQTLAP
jgi:hypothetical protein